MRLGRAALLAACLAVPTGATPAAAQMFDGASDRIWGTAETRSGDRISGWIRWDRNEVGWADLLNGSKAIPDEAYEVWSAAIAAGGRATERSIEYAGYRITWDDDRESFPAFADAGIRFGHIQALEVTGDQEVLLTLRSGEAVEFSSGSSDIGSDIREILVVEANGAETELAWDELEGITFGSAPADARSAEARLFGTVTDIRGEEWTGWIAWDLDEVFRSEILDGEVDGDEFDLPFERIHTIERRGWSGATVTTVEGEIHDVRGTNDVSEGNRGVLVTDPNLGLVTVPWDDFDVVTFHSVTRSDVWSDYDGGAPLFGTVEREDGTTIRGRIRWDADEEWDWEMLDGMVYDVDVDVEFANIRRLEKVGADGSIVFLHDGRELELEESNDVDSNNKGVFVMPSGSEEWVFVDWYDFAAVDFERMGRM